MISCKEAKQRMDMVRENAWNLNKENLIRRMSEAIEFALARNELSAQIGCSEQVMDYFTAHLKSLGYTVYITAHPQQDWVRIHAKGW